MSKITFVIAVSEYSHIDELGKAKLHTDFLLEGSAYIRQHGLDAFEQKLNAFCLDIAKRHNVKVVIDSKPLEDRLKVVFYDGISEYQALAA